MHGSKKLRHFVTQGTRQHAGGWQSGHVLDFNLDVACPKLFEKDHNRAWIEIDVLAKRDVVRIGCPAIGRCEPSGEGVQERSDRDRCWYSRYDSTENAFIVERN